MNDQRPTPGTPAWVHCELEHARQCLEERIEDGESVENVEHMRKRVRELEQQLRDRA